MIYLNISRGSTLFVSLYISDERLKTRVEESTCLTCTVLHDKAIPIPAKNVYFFFPPIFKLKWGGPEERGQSRTVPSGTLVQEQC